LRANSSGVWVGDTGGGWDSGRLLTWPGGASGPDTEALVVSGSTAYVGTERDAAGAQRTSILRFPMEGEEPTIRATHEWQLNAFYPGMSPTLGIEALTLVPNEVLVAGGFLDASTGRAFDPAAHPDQHGGGVFLATVEAPGLRSQIDAY